MEETIFEVPMSLTPTKIEKNFIGLFYLLFIIIILDGGGGRVQLDKSRDVVYFNSLDVISNNIFSDSTFRSCLHRQEYLSFCWCYPQKN